MRKIWYYFVDFYNRVFGVETEKEILIEVMPTISYNDINIEVSFYADEVKLNKNMEDMVKKEDYESAILIRDILNSKKK